MTTEALAAALDHRWEALLAEINHNLDEGEAIIARHRPLIEVAIRAETDADRTTGYHGEGEFDLHYDPWCPRCTEQRDRLRPPLEMDEVYAIVAEETP